MVVDVGIHLPKTGFQSQPVFQLQVSSLPYCIKLTAFVFPSLTTSFLKITSYERTVHHVT